MVHGVPSISVPTLSYSASSYGKMSLPVNSSSLIYSHFEHVSGIPAPDGTQGVAISKLNLLDVLIGQLNQMKKATPTQTSASPIGGVDALIDNLINQIRQTKSAGGAIPYTPSPVAEPGALFSLAS